MTVSELINELLKVHNQNAEVFITDNEEMIKASVVDCGIYVVII